MLALWLACADPALEGKVADPLSGGDVDQRQDPRDTGRSGDSADGESAIDSVAAPDSDVDTALVDTAPVIADTGFMASGDWVDVSAGAFFTCGVRSDGQLLCWGYAEDGADTDAPEGVFVSVSAGDGVACALSDLGEAVCWGGSADCCGVADTLADYAFASLDVDWTANYTGLTTDGDAINVDAYPYSFDLVSGPFAQVVARDSSGWAIDADGVSTFFGADEEQLAAAAPAGDIIGLGQGLRYCAVAPDGTLFEVESTAPWGYTTWPGDYVACEESGLGVLCGITSTGHIECAPDELSISGATDIHMPPPHALFSKVSIGYRHACGITTTGWMKCWGGAGHPTEGEEAEPPIDGDKYWYE